MFPTQLHDVQAGVRPHPDDPTQGGLFWTTQIPDDSFWVSHDRRWARLRLHDLCLIDTFQFFSNFDAPALFSCDVKFKATEKAVPRGLGTKGDDAAGTRWSGHVASAHASGRMKVWSTGYEADAHAASDPKGFKAPLGGWAQLGTERNGYFLDGAMHKKAAPPKDHDPKKAGAIAKKA